MAKINRDNNKKVRTTLLIVGPICLIAGFSLFLSGIISTSRGNTSLFFLGFIGIPLIFIGAVCLMFGLTGKIQRYMINETSQNAADATNFLLDETKDNIRDITDKEIRKCPVCHDEIRPGEEYCDKCGTKLSKQCPHCGNVIKDLDSVYCPKCGTKL